MKTDMRSLVIDRIRAFKKETNNFDINNPDWKDFYVSYYEPHQHISKLKFAELPNDFLLMFYDNLISHIATLK